MNTRAYKSLCYGPGLLDDQAINTPAEFIIQARNDLGENRTSGRDQFQVKIVSQGENHVEIPSEIIDNDDGQYVVRYQMNEEQKVKIDIQFLDDKGKWVPVRGSPYSASSN